MAGIQKREITKELKEAYLDYAMSVIVARALPDVRDGLKPVHRRVLWGMWDGGNTSSAKFKKSANTVGEVMGKYHPHGDSAIYDSLVRMAQDFSLRYPLIQGQGNFGSVDGDSPAAMRYCVTGDTLIATDKGLLPISEIVGTQGEGGEAGDEEEEDGSEEEISIHVLSHNRRINKAVRWFNSGAHPTVKVITQNGYHIQGSYNHPILTWAVRADGTPTFRWKLISELERGDVAVIDRTADLLWPEQPLDVTAYWPAQEGRREVKQLPSYLNEDLAHIIGALLAEGSIKENEIEFCNSDTVWMDEFALRWANVFPDCRLHRFDRNPSSFGKKPYQTAEIHSRNVVAFLRSIGLTPVKAGEKRVPFSILRSSKSVAASFLRAYFEGDGSITFSGKMTELSATSKSRALLEDTQTLLLRFGIVSALRFDSHRAIHKLYIRGLKNYKLFKDEIGFASERKSQKLADAIARIGKDSSATDFIPFVSDFTRAELAGTYGNHEFAIKNNFDRYGTLAERHEQVATLVRSDVRHEVALMFEQLLANNYFFDPIASVEAGPTVNVYSIKVASDCHSFVGNGIISHNTEARLSRISDEMLTDIDKETVDWSPNYDATRVEPKVLPAKLPNLLLNGTLGIAVGMATSIPPHNLREVVDAILHLADNPDATNEDLFEFVKGPDFPTGGTIYDKKAIRQAYISGRGGIMTRAKTEITERKNRQFDIVITEIPYQVNKSELIKKIAELVQDKKIEGIRDVRDESDREGMRIVIELKSDIAPQRILNQLFKFTDLQKDFHLNMIALVNGIEPRLLSLKDVLVEYIAHRKVIIRRRAEFDLKKAEERAHILEGLVKALDVIDKIIATIKKSQDKEQAHANLVKQFSLSALQATAILEMRLQALAALERKKLEDELAEKRALIKELQAILKNPGKMLGIIKDEITALREKYGDDRKTKVVAGGVEEVSDEDLIPKEEAVITLSGGGYVKRLPPDTFQSQRRGGRGLIGSDVAEEDFLSHFVSASTHDNILFFTDKGRVFQTKVYEIPAASRTSKGRAIHNFLELPSEETISAIVAYEDDEKRRAGNLIMATRHGIIKKTTVEDFKNIRKNGIIAIGLKKGDALMSVKLTTGKDQVIMTTAKGQAIRFKESQVRTMGRNASGIRGIKLKSSDHVAGFGIITEAEQKDKEVDRTLLVVMVNGFAKQTSLKEYKLQNRGGSGIRTANITAKTGELVGAEILGGEAELLALSAKGQVIRTELASVRHTGRAAQGVKIMNLRPGDRLAGVVII